MLKNALVATLAVLVGISAFPETSLAQENPFQIAFIGPTMQLVDDDADIRGLRLNLPYGVNANVYGWDLGFINHVNGEMKGWQLGLVNLIDERGTAWQAGLVNVTRGDFVGLQSGSIGHWPVLGTWGPMSLFSVANVARRGEGAQLGLFNQAETMQGFQLALVNISDDMYGVQVGLLNIIRSKDRFPILPLVNWKFE